MKVSPKKSTLYLGNQNCFFILLKDKSPAGSVDKGFSLLINHYAKISLL